MTCLHRYFDDYDILNIVLDCQIGLVTILDINHNLKFTLVQFMEGILEISTFVEGLPSSVVK